MLVGSCLCGTVRYELRATIESLCHCHCIMCQKAHGAAFGTYAPVVGQCNGISRYHFPLRGNFGYTDSATCTASRTRLVPRAVVRDCRSVATKRALLKCPPCALRSCDSP
jgi:hypothetical protein